MDLVDVFFGGIIPATLDEPTHPNIEFHEQSKQLSAIIGPRIDSEDGLLVFDFYDARETIEGYNDRRVGVPAHAAVKFDGGLSISAVATQLTTAAGGANGESVKHSGRLSVMQREVTLTNGPIAFAKFCIEDFPMFWGDIAFEKTEISGSISTFHSSFSYRRPCGVRIGRVAIRNIRVF